VVFVPGAGPLDIVVECLGWNGEILSRLGRFSRSHPPDEWDGRELTGRPGSGAFTITYKIFHTYVSEDEGTLLPADDSLAIIQGEWPLVHPDLPVPFNLRETDEWVYCFTSWARGGSTCSIEGAPGFAWDYPPTPDMTVLEGFRVYRRAAGESVPQYFHWVPFRPRG
jgi:hypothetical protein